MKFTQSSFPRYVLELSTAFNRLGLSTVSELVRFFFGVGVDALSTLIISAVVFWLAWYTRFSRQWVLILPLFKSIFFSFRLKRLALS